jgi:hypothetical protein
LQLGQVSLDPSRVYQVRGVSLDRSSIHISLEDGTIAFTEDVQGRITGAFFEGDGEVLLTPPNDVERKSLSLFTGMAILEEHFATAYFRFNDETAAEMRPDLRPTGKNQEFANRWSATVKNLGPTDAMRLMVTMSSLLPSKGRTSEGGKAGEEGAESTEGVSEDRFLHARLQGNIHGVFDVLYDSVAAEQVQAGQTRTAQSGELYYDVWTSFTPIEASAVPPSAKNGREVAVSRKDKPREDWLAVRRFAITAEVKPPKEIEAQARLEIEVKRGGPRLMLFELSRFLNVQSVKLDGEAVEFIHNPSVEGTQLARSGNDFVAVILPEAAQTGQKMDLEFSYAGEVLAEAGSGLLYVGARGTWYPNRGLVMSDFDLQFDYPPGWTLVATGKPSLATPDPTAKVKGLETSHWVSDRPIPVAGFNLGKYKVARAQAGNVSVETYATQAVERDFPSAPIQTIERDHPYAPEVPRVIVPLRPSPAQNEVTVGDAAARAIRYFAERFGPFPYSHLALTQMPGRDSQGWPGLVFLSSYAFLNNEERQQLHFGAYRTLLEQSIPAHETAHQWWGDLVSWEGYRDQWLSEGLASYCAAMMLQEKSPEGFRVVMNHYRQSLVEENKTGTVPKDAGPVTLGLRLLSSRFPEGYEAISYGRGAWLLHMLRTMLNDAAQKSGQKIEGSTDEPFVLVLRKVRQKYEGKAITTGELLDAFAEELPPSLRFEGKKSLDWFLEGWINGTSLPKLELSGVKFSPRGAGAMVSGTILQKEAPPDLVTSVPIYAVVPGKQPVLLGRVFADGEESTFRIAAPAGARRLLLDPYQTILTSVK